MVGCPNDAFLHDVDPERKRIGWGDRLELTPSHCCTCVNQHEEMLVVRNGRVAAVWPITARGKYT
jgi:3-hydroxy-D-aspartate aldolase